MIIYGYHHPNADGRLFLSTCKPKVDKNGGSVDTGFGGHIGWIDDGAEKLGLKPGEYVKFELVKGEAKRMPTSHD